MKIELLKAVATFFSTFERINICKRIKENLFLLELYKIQNEQRYIQRFYIDVRKGQSLIFIADVEYNNNFMAPFDKKLKSITSHAKLIKAETDGENRILKLFISQTNSYKIENFILQFEFTGKYTNVILLDEDQIVKEALRHISKSIREVKVGSKLESLEQITHKNAISPIEQKDIKNILEQNYKTQNDKELASRKQIAIRYLQKKIDKNLMILASLTNKDKLERQGQLYKMYGEKIFTNIYKIQNNFKDYIEIQDNKNILQIPYPTDFKGNRNNIAEIGNLYFELSKKIHKKSQSIHLQEQNLKQKNEFLQSQKDIIENTANIEYVDIFNQPKQRHDKKQGSIYESFFINGIKISFGRNERENLALLKDAKAHEMWLHLREIHSSHMIIHTQKVEAILLEKCGEILSKLYGKRGNYDVDYTLRKFVKIIHGANVIYSKHNTLSYKI